MDQFLEEGHGEEEAPWLCLFLGAVSPMPSDDWEVTSGDNVADRRMPRPPSFPLPEAGPKAALMITGGTLLSGPPISIIKAT